MSEPNLTELIELARQHVTMTKSEQRNQIISFAYGNVKIHNSAITREMVAKAYDDLEAAKTEVEA